MGYHPWSPGEPAEVQATIFAACENENGRRARQTAELQALKKRYGYA
jgi:hypothetical protein